jgi:hypothetical protein
MHLAPSRQAEFLVSFQTLTRRQAHFVKITAPSNIRASSAEGDQEWIMILAAVACGHAFALK